MEKLAVVILNYNTWEDTIKEIEHVRDLLGINYKQFIVVDNKSTNNSAEELKKYAGAHNIVLLFSDENKGYAAGNNIGLKYAEDAGYKFAWILNNDIVFEDKNSAEKLLSIFGKDDKIAVVNPDVYAPNGHLFNRDTQRYGFWDMTLGMYSYKKRGRKLIDIGGYGLVYRPQGCCMIVDLAKMKDINYMDENTFLYSEEIILAEKLLDFEYVCVCVPDVKIIHNHSHTVKSNMQKSMIIGIKQESFKYYLQQYRRYGKIKTATCLFFNYLKLKVLE